MPKSAEQGGSPASASHEALRHILDAGASMGSLQGLDEAQQQALYAIAHGAYEQGRYADALKMFCLLVACDPLEARYLLALGAAARSWGCTSMPCSNTRPRRLCSWTPQAPVAWRRVPVCVGSSPRRPGYARHGA